MHTDSNSPSAPRCLSSAERLGIESLNVRVEEWGGIVETCPQCAGSGPYHPCKGSGGSGYFLVLPGPAARPCPHCRGGSQCPGCRGSEGMVDWVRGWLPGFSVLTSPLLPISVMADTK